MLYNNQSPKQKREQLYSYRQRYVSNWQRVAEFVEPDRRFNLNGAVQESTPNNEGYIDTTLERALRLNATGQHELVMPKASEWFTFTPLAKAADRELVTSTVDDEYAETARVVSMFMRNSNLHTASELFFWDRAAYGIGAFWAEWDTRKRGFSFYSIPVGTFMVDKDKFGRMNMFCWDDWMRNQDIVATFPEKNLPQTVKDKYMANSNSPDNYLVFHLLERVERTGDEGLIARADGKEWVLRSVYDATGDVLLEQFFKNCPVICCNCFDLPNSPYGYGFGKVSLADQIELVNCLKALAEAAQQKIFPPMLVPEGFQGNIGYGAGEVTTFNPLNIQARPSPLFQQASQTSDCQWQIERFERVINEACDVNLFMPLLQVKDPQYMKATVAQMIESYSARISSTAYTRLIEQFLQPLVDFCYNTLVQHGYVRPFRDYHIQFCTPFQILLDRHQPTLFTEFLQTVVIPLSQIDPSVLDSLDADYIFRRSMLDIGLSPKYSRPETKVKQMRRERQSAQDEANQMANAKTFSEVQKNLGAASKDMNLI